jgi:hypothetical protein
VLIFFRVRVVHFGDGDDDDGGGGGDVVLWC